MENRDKKILIGVGVSLVVSVSVYFYNGYRETELVANAKYKAVSGGLDDAMKKMAESGPQSKIAAKDVTKDATKDSVKDTTKEATQDTAKNNEAKTVPVESRATASVPPVAAPPMAQIQIASFSEQKKSDADTSSAPPSFSNAAATVAPAPALQNAPDLKLNDLAVIEDSLYLRYKGFLFRVSLKKGIHLGSPQLNGFSGQRVETIVSDDTQADCKKNCYQLSEKLIGQLKDAKSARTFLKTQAWFLVADQVNGSCEAASSKKLLVTQDIEAKCIIGMVTEGKTVHMAAHDAHAALDASSVIIMQRVASRAPASEN